MDRFMAGRRRNPNGSILEVKQDDKPVKADDAIASVIVTFVHGNSYDNLFGKIKQESEFGKVIVYKATGGNIYGRILRALQGEAIPVEECKNAAEQEALNGWVWPCLISPSFNFVFF